MRMIDKIIRAMQDTGLIDGMSMEDCDTLATAALEGMREPNSGMLVAGGDGWFAEGDVWRAMIDAALNE